jgi:hypothetical protein
MNLTDIYPRIRAAAERFERETADRSTTISHPAPVDEPMIALFPIVNGYPPIPGPDAVAKSG